MDCKDPSPYKNYRHHIELIQFFHQSLPIESEWILVSYDNRTDTRVLKLAVIAGYASKLHKLWRTFPVCPDMESLGGHHLTWGYCFGLTGKSCGFYKQLSQAARFQATPSPASFFNIRDQSYLDPHAHFLVHLVNTRVSPLSRWLSLLFYNYSFNPVPCQIYSPCS